MRAGNKIAYQSPQLALISRSQIQDLHLAALELLRRTGIRFHHQETLDILRTAGGFVSEPCPMLTRSLDPKKKQ